MQEERKAIKEDKSKGRNQKKREKLSRDEIHFCKEKKEKKKSMLGYETEKKKWDKSLMYFWHFLRVKKLLPIWKMTLQGPSNSNPSR